ncbi:hypothetical protein GCM10027280_18060 [Micromonospora polyrhachis]|uniref:Uncharacterized protein n=1 Tax=Micromonospora polyrhachis TaxID=1282883 RepID=A0A7W7SLC4_9ACTN|nr:hypothetical protein [Micromonospora polyrhachis]MBB4956903.1 hypothetical protein [Micromonospora polyrhachis]
MPSYPPNFADQVVAPPARAQFEAFLDDDDTIATIQHAHREACEASRHATSSPGLDDILSG